jgi:hypothetical protein
MPRGGKVGLKWSEFRQIQAGGVKLLVNFVSTVIAGMVRTRTERI